MNYFEDLVNQTQQDYTLPNYGPMFFVAKEHGQTWNSFHMYALNLGEWRWHKLYYDHVGGMDWRLTISVPSAVQREPV